MNICKSREEFPEEWKTTLPNRLPCSSLTYRESSALKSIIADIKEENERLKIIAEKYSQLINEVELKYQGETRFDTTIRYLKEYKKIIEDNIVSIKK